jgi:organic hydroperoxide reductase OsmC/OhrA
MNDARHEYPVTVRWISEKDGLLESADGLPPLPVASPPQFGGKPGIWSPEHLLVGAVSSCLLSTFLAVAEISGLRVLSFEAPAVGTLERGDDRRYRFALVEVHPRLTVASDADAEKAARLLPKAEAACLVTRSLSCPVLVHPRIEVAEPAFARP